MSQRALLRNGVVVKLAPELAHVPGFPMTGEPFSGGEVELWTARGRYREDGTEHPRDITHLIAADGQMHPFVGIITK